MHGVARAASIATVLLSMSAFGVHSTLGATLRISSIAPAATIIEPDDGVRPLTRLIDRARKTVFVEAYILSDRTIMHALERASTEGVNVDVLLEHHPLGLGSYPERVRDELLAAGIAVRWSSTKFVFTHAKFLVIDDATAVISTANFSRSAFEGNREALVVDTDARDVHDVSNIFRADWDHIPATFAANDLVVAPINARSDLQAFVNGARRSIDIYAEELRDPSMEDVLLRRERAHVRVRVLLPPSALRDTGTPNSLIRRRLSVHALETPYVHAKVVVVDGREAFVGSENLSSTSLDRNRELGIFVHGSAVTRLESVFAQDWARS